MKWHGWGISIGCLSVVWIDLWTRQIGLWLEWDKAPKRLLNQETLESRSLMNL